MRISSRATSAALLAFACTLGSAAMAAEAPPIVARDAWGARAPTMAMPANTPMRLTIHHTATRQKPDRTLVRKLQSLQAFSQSSEKLADGRTKKAWGDVPYHFYIAADGQVGQGREVAYVGDTNTRYDPSGHIGIVVEGNFDHEQPTEVQLIALTDLLVYLAATYHIDPQAIGAHQDFAQTACPGEHLLAYLPGLRATVASRLANGG